jgi:hypothetical protein
MHGYTSTELVLSVPLCYLLRVVAGIYVHLAASPANNIFAP